MNIYAIGDLHLSGQPPKKPMSMFGAQWENHWQKIKISWLESVREGDLVILCGDTSWAMKFGEALSDLQEIATLPGKKVFVRGNHDYWWTSVSKMNTTALDGCFFLHNNYYLFGSTAICGSRGWLIPGEEEFSPEDEKIYLHEVQRAENSLAAAKNAGQSDIILALHYPPLYSGSEASGFSLLCDKYQVKDCLYGHLHGESTALAREGKYNATNYHLVSADSLNFSLAKIR